MFAKCRVTLSNLLSLPMALGLNQVIFDLDPFQAKPLWPRVQESFADDGVGHVSTQGITVLWFHPTCTTRLHVGQAGCGSEPQCWQPRAEPWAGTRGACPGPELCECLPLFPYWNPLTDPKRSLQCCSAWKSPNSSNCTEPLLPQLFANLDFMKPDHFSKRPLDPGVHPSHRAMCLPTGISTWTVNDLISFSSYTEFIDFCF